MLSGVEGVITPCVFAKINEALLISMFQSTSSCVLVMHGVMYYKLPL